MLDFKVNDDNFFKVKMDKFEGPLDLLLSLIEERKLFINEISLSLITEDYANYINKIKDDYTGQKYYEITGYLVVLATLLLIKSRSLLPNFEISKDEKVTIDDLEDRLNLYKVYKDFSKNILSIYNKNNIYQKQPKKSSVVFIPDEQINILKLREVMDEVLNKKPAVLIEKEDEKKTLIVKSKITLEEVVNKINEKINQITSFSFNEFSSIKKVSSKEEKVFVVISFLAILELIRNGLLDGEQNDLFSDINIKSNNIINYEQN
jgi:segregation and condensation protein A